MPPGIATATASQLTASRVKAQPAWILAGALLAAVVLVGCLPLLAGKASPLWDACDYFGPLFSLVADHAKSGRLMLWDPWINGGSPDFAEPQVGTASPVLLAFALLSSNPFHGFIAYWLVVWIGGGIGMLLLCRHLGAPPWGGLVVALGFVASGVYTGNAEHTSWIYSFSFLPWIVWRFDKGLLERNYWFIVQAGVFWGLSAQGGYPGVTIANSLFLVLWAAGRVWISGEPSGEWVVPRTRDSRTTGTALKHGVRRFAFALAICGAIAFAVMSPAYASFQRENRGYTFRAGGLDRQFSISSGALPPAAYATVASPYIYRLRPPDQRPLWPETDISMTNIYMGVLVPILALAAFVRPSRWRIWLLLMAVFFGCCAVGSHLPVRGWLYDFVPPTRYFRMPSLFRMYVIVIAGALAALSTRDLEINWQQAAWARAARGLFPMSAIVGVAAVLAYSRMLHSVGQRMGSAPYPLFQLLFTWMAAMLIFFLGGRGVLSRKVWMTAAIALAAFDAGSTLYLSNPTMYSYPSLTVWQAASKLHVSSLNLFPRGWQRSLLPPEATGTYLNDRNVAPKVATFCNRTPLKNTYFQHYLDDPMLSRMAIGDQRIWFSEHPVWLSPTDANFAAFAQKVHASGPILALHSPAEMLGQAPLLPASSNWSASVEPMLPAAADLVSYLPNLLAFRYHADRDGWLLVTDRWANAWTATVNGAPQPIFGGNFIFRAVQVIRGDNLIQFRYRPQGYVARVALSWSVVVIVLLIQVWMLATRHKPRSARAR